MRLGLLCGTSAVAMLAPLFVAGAAAAQDAGQGANPGDPGRDQSYGSVLLDEVVVTARKRASGEAAQDTPIAITAFSEAQYEAVFATELSDVGDLSPNVELKPSTIVGLQNFTIRGMGVTGSTPSDSPTVGVFQNGVFWGSNYGAMIDTFDIETIEILRGPQGTLFGRNVTGGAVSVRTKRPNGEFAAEAEATVGTYGRADLSAAVQGSLIEGVLAGRLVGSYRTFDGFFKNLETGEDYGGSETELLRGTLVFTPTEALEIALIAEHYKESGDSTPVIGIERPGTQPYNAGFRQPDDYFDLRLDKPGTSDITVDSVTLEMNLDIGPGVMTSVTGYRDVENNNNTDFDGTNFLGFHQAIAYASEQFTQELRYAADINDWFSFTLGAYYFELEHDFREGRNLTESSIIFATGNHVEQESSAVFGEADVRLPWDLTLTLGARYTDESITAQTVPFSGCPLPANLDPDRYLDLSLPCNLGPSETATFNDVSPKVGLSWKPDDNNLVYATATRGFRSGGFSLRGQALTPPFDSEQVNAYEIGYKGDLFDRRLRLNAALFHNEYQDLQRTIVFTSPTLGTLQKTGNAAEATIQGAELDITWQATDHLVLTGSYGFTDASFDSFVGLDVTGDGVPDPELASQLNFVRVPENTFTLAANYDQPLASGAQVKFRAAVNYTGSEFLDDLNLLKEPSYTLVDASATWVSPDGRWEASVFGKNLGDKEYAYYSASLGIRGLVELAGPPRTAGVRVTYKY